MFQRRKPSTTTNQAPTPQQHERNDSGAHTRQVSLNLGMTLKGPLHKGGEKEEAAVDLSMEHEGKYHNV